ncbi:MAG: ROK family protein, partial [Vicinamibacterales bacterium]
ALGVDLGADHVRALRVNERGEVIARSARSPGRAGLASTLRDVLRARRSKDGTSGEPPGVALPWATDEVPTDVTTTLAQGAPMPVLIGVGAATALAEAWCGAARGTRDLITFGVDEHVTAGVLVDGVVLRGAHGYAGSVEWLSLNPVERADYRRYGGLGAEVSAAGIVRRVVWRIKSGDRSAVADSVGGDLSRIAADLVFAAAHAGDGVSISVVRDTARYVAMAVSNMAAVLDPQTIVLGGILATSGAQMLDAIRVECSRRMRPSQAGRITIVLSTLGPDAAAIGAARAALLQRQ